MRRLLCPLAVCLAAGLLGAPSALADTTVTQTVAPGGSVSTDPPGTEPTPENPVVVTVKTRENINAQGPVTVTITRRDVPGGLLSDAETGTYGEYTGPAVDIRYDGNFGARATFEVDPSLQIPGYTGGGNPLHLTGISPTGPEDEAAVNGLRQPDGDISFTGVVAQSDTLRVQRPTFRFLLGRNNVADQKLSAVLSKGLKAPTSANYLCRYTLTATISRSSARTLRLKSPVIARKVFPTCAVDPKLILNAAAKKAFRKLPRAVRKIRYDLAVTGFGPFGKAFSAKPPGPPLGFAIAVDRPGAEL